MHLWLPNIIQMCHLGPYGLRASFWPTWRHHRGIDCAVAHVRSARGGVDRGNKHADPLPPFISSSTAYPSGFAARSSIGSGIEGMVKGPNMARGGE